MKRTHLLFEFRKLKNEPTSKNVTKKKPKPKVEIGRIKDGKTDIKYISRPLSPKAGPSKPRVQPKEASLKDRESPLPNVTIENETSSQSETNRKLSQHVALTRWAWAAAESSKEEIEATSSMRQRRGFGPLLFDEIEVNRNELVRETEPNERETVESSKEKKGCKEKVNDCTNKFKVWWRKFMEKKEEWDKWNPNPENPFVKCIKYSKLAALKETIKSNRTIFSRFGWSSVFVICLMGGIKLSVEQHKFHKANPILNELKEPIEITKLPAPTVTICPSSNFKLTALREAEGLFFDAKRAEKFGLNETRYWNTEKSATLLYFIDHTCIPKTTLSSQFENYHKNRIIQDGHYAKFIENKNISDDIFDPILTNKVIPFLSKGSRNCTEMIKYCSWNMEAKESCESYFSPVFTGSGGCCSFNGMPKQVTFKGNLSLTTLWNNQENSNISLIEQWKKYRLDSNSLTHESNDERSFGTRSQSVAKPPWGLSMVLSNNDTDVACPQFDSGGYRATFTVPGSDMDVEPVIVFVPSGHEVNTKLYPELTIADEDIRSVSLEKRGCYFSDEFNLTYYSIYTQDNCRRECVAKKITAECGCTHRSSPNSAGQILCHPKKFQCMKDAERNMNLDKVFPRGFGKRIIIIGINLFMILGKMLIKGYGKHCSHCLPSCTQLKYKVVSTTSTTPFTEVNFLPMLHGMGKDASILTVGFGTDTVVPNGKSLRFSQFDLITQIGSSFESTNDISFIGVVRILLSLTFLTPIFWILYKYAASPVLYVLRNFRKFLCICFTSQRKRERIGIESRNVQMINFIEISGSSLETQSNIDYNVFLAVDDNIV